MSNKTDAMRSIADPVVLFRIQEGIQVKEVDHRYRELPFHIDGRDPALDMPIARNYFLRLIWLVLSTIRAVDQRVEEEARRAGLEKVGHPCVEIKCTETPIRIKWVDEEGPTREAIEKAFDGCEQTKVVTREEFEKFFVEGVDTIPMGDVEVLPRLVNRIISHWNSGKDRLVFRMLYRWEDGFKAFYLDCDECLRALARNYFRSKNYDCPSAAKVEDSYEDLIADTCIQRDYYKEKRMQARSSEVVFWYNNCPLSLDELLGTVNRSARDLLREKLDPIRQARKTFYTQLGTDALPSVQSIVAYLEKYSEFINWLLYYVHKDEAFFDTITESMGDKPFSVLDVLLNLDTEYNDKSKQNLDLMPSQFHPYVLHAMLVVYRYLCSYALLSGSSAPKYEKDAPLTRMLSDYIAFSRIRRNLELRFYFGRKEYCLQLDYYLDPMCHAFRRTSVHLLSPIAVVRLKEKIERFLQGYPTLKEIKILVVGNWDTLEAQAKKAFLQRMAQEQALLWEHWKDVQFEVVTRRDPKYKGLQRTDGKFIQELSAQCHMLFMMDADDMLLKADSKSWDWPRFRETLRNDDYACASSHDMWKKDANGFYDVREVVTHEFSRVYRFLGALGTHNSGYSTDAMVFRTNVLENIGEAIQSVVTPFDVYYYILHYANVDDKDVRWLDCCHTERYDGRDISILYWSSPASKRPEPQEESGEHAVFLDAWQFIKAAHSYAYSLLRGCQFFNEHLPERDEEIHFVQAMRDYHIIMRYVPNPDNGKLNITLERKMGEFFTAYFGQEEANRKRFDELLQHYLLYLIGVLRREVFAGGLERCLTQSILDSILSHCQTPQDLLLYYLIRQDAKCNDLLVFDTKKKIGDYDGEIPVLKNLMSQMPRKLYYFNLIERCHWGYRWEDREFLRYLEERNSLYGCGTCDRDKALRKIVQAAELLKLPRDHSFYKLLAAPLDA